MLSIIIIDYNSIEMTISYIKSFVKTSVTNNLHFIIVDNFVGSNATESLKKEFTSYFREKCEIGEILRFSLNHSEIVYHYTGKNLGFAKGNNRGFLIQKELYNDSVVLFSNSDIRLIKKFDINAFNKIFEIHGDVAVIGPDVVKLDGIKQNPHKKTSAFNRLIRYYWQMLIPFVKIKGDYDYSDCSKKCYWVSGCFMIVSAPKFEKVGGFDEYTFLFGEEMILAERFARFGYTEFYYRDYSIVHETGGTVARFNSRAKTEKMCFESLCYYYLNYRNTSPLFIYFSKINFFFCMALLRFKYMFYKR